MTVPRRLLWRIWLPATMFGAWEIAARAGLLNRLFFPPPSSLLSAGIDMLRTGELTMHLKVALLRTLGGAGIGIVTGIACGLLMGVSAGVRRSVDSLFAALMAAPKLSLLPLLMLLLGIGEAPLLTLIAAAAFLVTTLHTLDGILALDQSYVEMGRNYGARPAQLVRWVYLPSCLPHLFTGLRVAFSRALGVCVSVEIVGAREGIGQMIWGGWQSFRPEHIYLGVFLAAALGALVHTSLRLVERQVLPWKN